MLSNAFSKRDATIIAVLLVAGVALTIESHHHVWIIAPAVSADTATFAAGAGNIQLSASSEPVNASTFEPAFALTAHGE